MSKYKRIYVDGVTHKALKQKALDEDKSLTEFMKTLVNTQKKKKRGLFDEIGF